MQLYDYEREHLETLRTILPECTVLLKSDNTFPLEKPEKVALFGEGARHTIKGGTGSGDVNSRFTVNVEEGLKNAGFDITSTAWLDAYDEVLDKAKKDFLNEIKARAKEHHTLAIMEGMGAVMPSPEYTLPLKGEGDLAIYVLARNSGEGNDRDFIRGDILLSETEKRDILELNKKFKRFLLVLNVGGPIDLSELKEVKNILVLSQLGVETGNALADLLLGKTYPSGKLTTSWAYEENFCKIGDFGDRDETRYTEGVYVGYRYYDTVGIKNDFPFGYGLGYTTFEISNTGIAYSNGRISVKADVKNTGVGLGKEAVQVYVSSPDGEIDVPYQALAGFVKTKELKPNETQSIEVSFDFSSLASYDERISAFVLQKGRYLIHVGNSSTNTSIAGIISLDKTVNVLQTRKCCGDPDFKDWKPIGKKMTHVSEDIPVIEVDASTIETRHVDYSLSEEVDPFIDGLTDEELAYINIGNFNPKGGVMSVIGEASSKVAGAAGETTSRFEDKGFPVMVMSDGPAGLRLAKQYVKAENKLYTIGSPLPAGFEDLLPKIAIFFMKLTEKKPPKDAKVLEQYCTAIPIGTAIAQSFNYELAKKCGDIVGTEMERFGIQLWLAPALNIHRSFRCGRNFEYYSEDPLVSGLMAAAITEGVQSHKGCGTTIKHYAANNQETSRYTNNSQVSERAMREIYLRGFGICVEKSQPVSVMTSYNLLNGVHTSERRDLNMDILRAEFGFEGIVMTDWVVAMMADKKAKYDTAYASKVAKAGGDLFMPGSKKDYENLLAALKSGEVDRKQVKINATRVFRMAKKLHNR